MSRARLEWIIVLGLLGWMVSLAFVSPARADGEWLRVHWTTTPACVDSSVLPNAAEAMLGERPSAMAIELAAHADAHAQWRVELSVAGEPGVAVRRTLRSGDCATLTQAVALVIAVQADPVATAASLSAVRSPSLQQPEPIVAVVPAIETRAEPARPPPPIGPRDAGGSADGRPTVRARPRLGLGAAVAGELGMTPNGAATLELSAGPVWPRARLDAVALAALAPAFDAGDGVGVSFSTFAGAVRGCGVLGGPRLEVLPCGGLELGAFIARGRGVATESVRAVWLAAVAGVRPQLVLRERFGIGLLVEMVVPFTRHQYSVGDREVHAVASVAARLGASFRVRLP